MSNKKEKSNKVQLLSTAKKYIAPDIEIVEIEIEQNIFAGSGDLPGMQGEPW